jgi:DNA adenine methylase
VRDRARAGHFVYFDPPYVPLSTTSSFTSYTKGNFGDEDQRKLASVYRELADRGCRVMLSNSNAPRVLELYRGFRIEEVQARRMINSRGDRRGHVTEVVVLNYEPRTGELLSAATASRTASAKAAKLGKRGTRASR